jgi:hypothetical protein
MSPRITGKTEMLAVRFDHVTVARLDEVAAKASKPGLSLTRSDAVRMVVEAGLPLVEEREGIAQEKTAKPKR